MGWGFIHRFLDSFPSAVTSLQSKRASLSRFFLPSTRTMESHTLDLYPNRGPVHMALFRKVTNAPELRQRLIAQDQSLSYALIDASLILNPFHALLAVNRAVHDEQNNQLKSHNINSEIVIELSPNYNV